MSNTRRPRRRDTPRFDDRKTFVEPLHVGRPNIGDRQQLLIRINDALDRRWLTNKGPLVTEFEEAIAGYLGARHCIATCNGTMALAVALRALGISGEVIVPSFTFVATVHALQWHGLTPVFCDVRAETHCLDPQAAEALITPATGGILPVHLWGNACDLEAFEALSKQHSLPLLYDAAHAFGCSSAGRYIGTFGRAEIFSFHATKFINCFEGGAITTNDDTVAERARMMINFGFAGLDQVISLGINGKMNEISAAMGLTSLESLAEFLAANRRNYQAYERVLRKVPGLKLFAFDKLEAHNCQFVVVLVDPTQSRISRDALVDTLRSENVLAKRYFYPGVHRMAPYDALYPDADERLPNTLSLCESVMCLPTGTAICETEIVKICELLAAKVRQARGD